MYVATLPDCEATHTGTVAVTDGGVNVTGTSIFNDDVGVAADVNVEGDVNASQVHATQGISAVRGGIWDRRSQRYDLFGRHHDRRRRSVGRGFRRPPGHAGNADAIAIGNNAQAMQGGSVAVGLDAASTGTNATAVGTGATASADDTIAIGSSAQANATGSAAYGQGAVANLTQQQVFGTAANTYAMPGITSNRAGPVRAARGCHHGCCRQILATDGGQYLRNPER